MYIHAAYIIFSKSHNRLSHSVVELP